MSQSSQHRGLSPGDPVIIDEADCASPKMIVILLDFDEKREVWRGRYICTAVAQLEVHGQPGDKTTHISEFGKKIERATNNMYRIVDTGTPPTATYSDGELRNWQDTSGRAYWYYKDYVGKIELYPTTKREPKTRDAKHMIGRLVMREEGQSLNAYYSRVDSMEGAILMGHIKLAAVERNPALANDFADLMKAAISDGIETLIGAAPVWEEPVLHDDRNA